MDAFRECGWPAWAALGMSGIGLFVAIVALSLAVMKPRVGGVFSVVALAIALGPGGCGAAGTYWGRSRVDEVLASGAVEPSLEARIREQGYAEAGQCTNVGLVATAPPLVLAGLAFVIALARRRRPD